MNIDQYKADSPVISSIKDNEQLNATKSTNFIVMIPCSETHLAGILPLQIPEEVQHGGY